MDELVTGAIDHLVKQGFTRNDAEIIVRDHDHGWSTKYVKEEYGIRNVQKAYKYIKQWRATQRNKEK